MEDDFLRLGHIQRQVVLGRPRRPTVWPLCTNVADRQDRQDRQRTDSIGRTVLQTVTQKLKLRKLKLKPSSFSRLKLKGKLKLAERLKRNKN